MADNVGRERILVMHGTVDNLITIPHVENLVKAIGVDKERGTEVKKVIFEGRGHYLPYEEREEFKRLVTEVITKAEVIDGR